MGAFDWLVEALPIGPGLVKKHGRLDVNRADPRITDPSVTFPAPHAASHGDGGSDEITIAESQVTGLTADLAARIPASISDAKGDLIVGSANDAVDNLTVGTDGKVLMADSGQTLGVKWQALAASDVSGVVAQSLADAKGDLFVATANDTVARLPVGTNGDTLVADSTQTAGVKWATPGAGTLDLDDLGDVNTTGVADGDVLTYDSGSGDWVAEPPAGGVAGLTLITPTSVANSGGSASLSGSTCNFSGVTSVSINGVFSSTYDNYRIIIAPLDASANIVVNMRLRVSGTDASGATDYRTRYTYAYGASSTGGSLDTGTQWTLASVDDDCVVSMDIYQPAVARKTLCTAQRISYQSDVSHYVVVQTGAVHVLSTAYDGFTLLVGSNNITGSVSVYGYAK